MKKTRLMIFGLAIMSLSLTVMLFTSSKVEVVSGTLLANMEAIADNNYCDEAYGPCDGPGGSNGAVQVYCYDKVYTYADPECYSKGICYTIATWGFECSNCYTYGLIGHNGNRWVCRFS